MNRFNRFLSTAALGLAVGLTPVIGFAETPAMSFDQFFKNQLEQLKQDGNYRYFADLERKTGKFPQATNHFEGGTRDVTVWCSNDYLGMGQHPAVIAAMQEAVLIVALSPQVVRLNIL